jgi:hypothetical protein
MEDGSALSRGLLLEFAARKEQILNLETRQFVLFLAFQLVFLVFCLVFIGRKRKMQRFDGIALAIVLLGLFFHMLAINAKMSMVAAYLAYLEAEIEKLGAGKVIWDRYVVPMWIFGTQNNFKILATLTASIIVCQLSWSFVKVAIEFYESTYFAIFVVALIGALLLLYLNNPSGLTEFHDVISSRSSVEP